MCVNDLVPVEGLCPSVSATGKYELLIGSEFRAGMCDRERPCVQSHLILQYMHTEVCLWQSVNESRYATHTYTHTHTHTNKHLHHLIPALRALVENKVTLTYSLKCLQDSTYCSTFINQ